MKNVIIKKEGKTNGHCYIKLPIFEGPFDLLFYLVNKEELNIHEVPLAKITRQYLQYLQSMQELQVEIASEFLVMAAALLQLKSRFLLPQPSPFLNGTEEGDAFFFGSKETLVRRLLEYKRFKMAAAILEDRTKRQERIFLRDAVPRRYFSSDSQGKTDPCGLENLKEAWLKMIEKNKRKDQPSGMIYFTSKTSFVGILRRVVISLRKNTFFNSYLDDFDEKGTREERITIFTLFLELARRGRLSLRQIGNFGRIRILKPLRKGRTSSYGSQKNKKNSTPDGHH